MQQCYFSVTPPGYRQVQEELRLSSPDEFGNVFLLSLPSSFLPFTQ